MLAGEVFQLFLPTQPNETWFKKIVIPFNGFSPGGNCGNNRYSSSVGSRFGAKTWKYRISTGLKDVPPRDNES